MSSSHGRPPFLLGLRSSTWLIAITVYFATFTDGFVYGIIVPVTPFVLTDRLGVPEDQVQLWTSVMLAVFGGSSLLVSPLVGYLADRSPSRQLPFLVGLLIAFASTLLYTFARSPAMLVLGRLLQGCSVSIVFTVGLALLADTVGPDEIGQWIGFVLSGMNMGVMISPFLGGIVYQKAGYYAVCAMGLGVIGLDLLLRLLIIEKKDAKKYREERGEENTQRRIERVSGDSQPALNKPNGYGTNSNGADFGNRNGMVDSLGDGDTDSSVDNYSSSSPTERDRLIPGSPVTTASARSEESLPFGGKVFPVSSLLLSSPRVWTALYGALVHLGIISGFDSILPLFVHRKFGWESMDAGLIFLAITLPSLLGSGFGKASDRLGPRLVTLTGFALSVPALGLLALVQRNENLDKVLLCVFLVVIGTGLNMLLAPLASEINFAVEDCGRRHPKIMGGSRAYAQAYSLFNCALASGQLLGPSLAGLVYNWTNWQITVVILAAFCATGAIPVALFTSGPLKASLISRG